MSSHHPLNPKRGGCSCYVPEGLREAPNIIGQDTPPSPQHQAPQPSPSAARPRPTSRFNSPRSRIILFVALLLPLIGGSLGLFFTMQQTALDSAHALATAQAQANIATKEANAN